MTNNLFDQLDFGEFEKFIQDDDITDISYCNDGQIWIRSLKNGSLRIDNHGITNAAVEKLAFQCSNVMGTTFNTAKPFLDAESSELRMNFVHDSVATNGIALVIRKTPAKIRLKEEKLLEDDYITKDIHDFLIKCVLGHCNIMVCGETGSGKTEFVKYLASHTKESEKIITIEDTLELHLDRIYPNRDIVSMKTNNIASYSDVLVTCMRQNPKWILLSEVRSAEAVSAVRNSISSGHNILSTIHSDKASAIPHRLYSLMETDLDVDQFLNTIYRYIQLGVHIKAYYSKEKQKFHREIDEITEFYVDEDNKPVYNVIFQRSMTGKIMKKEISKHLREYLENQNINLEAPVESKNGLDPDLDKLVEAQAELNEKFSIKEEVEEKPINYIDSAINFDKPIDENNSINNVSIGGNTNFNNENQIPLTFKVEDESSTNSSDVINNDVNTQNNETTVESVTNIGNTINSVADNMEIPLPTGTDIQTSLGPIDILNSDINNISVPNNDNTEEIVPNSSSIGIDINENIEIPLPNSNEVQANTGSLDILSSNVNNQSVPNSGNSELSAADNIEIPLPSGNEVQKNVDSVNVLNSNFNSQSDSNSSNIEVSVTDNIEIPLPVANQPQLSTETVNSLNYNANIQPVQNYDNTSEDVVNSAKTGFDNAEKIEIPLPFSIGGTDDNSSDILKNNLNDVNNQNALFNPNEAIVESNKSINESTNSLNNTNSSSEIGSVPTAQTNRFILNQEEIV